MAGLEELRRLYEGYLAGARQAEAKLRPFDGFLGVGHKSSDDPCHSRFTEALWGEYRAAFPRWERLPMQKTVLAALDAARKRN